DGTVELLLRRRLHVLERLVEDEQARLVAPVAARPLLRQRQQHLDALLAQPGHFLGRAGPTQGRQQRLLDPGESMRGRHQFLRVARVRAPSLLLVYQRSGLWPKWIRSRLACSQTLSSLRKKSPRLAVVVPSASAASLSRAPSDASTSSTTPT